MSDFQAGLLASVGLWFITFLILIAITVAARKN